MKSDVHDPHSENEHTISDLSKKKSFLLDGLQVYDIATRKYISHQKAFGRNLNEETMKEAVHQFVNGYQTMKSKEVVRRILRRLQSVRMWALSQQKFSFYRSSLLLVYDAQFFLTSTISDSLPNLATTDDVTCVRMVDFAKYQESTETDHLYVKAVDNLIGCFLELLQ